MRGFIPKSLVLYYFTCSLVLFFQPTFVMSEIDLTRCNSILKEEGRLLCVERLTKYHEKNQTKEDFFEDLKVLIEEDRFTDARNRSNQFQSALSEKQINLLEKLLLSRVKPIPSSEKKKNYEGYRLLFAFKPNNLKYLSKIQRYSEQDDIQKGSLIIEDLRLEIEDFTKEKLYYHPSDPTRVSAGSRISLLLRNNFKGYVNLKMRTIYVADSWLWVNRVSVLVDGTSYQLTRGEFTRDNNQKIWEWISETPTVGQILLLEKIANGKKVTVRYHGEDFYDDRNLTRKQKTAIREILSIYKGLQEIRKTEAKSELNESFVPQRIIRSVGSKPMRCFDPERKIVYSHSPFGMPCGLGTYPISDADFFKMK
jgi:hypothetical protein